MDASMNGSAYSALDRSSEAVGGYYPPNDSRVLTKSQVGMEDSAI